MSLLVDLRCKREAFLLDVQFEAPDGLTVLFGRSGSGKTTVINAVAGLIQPDQGRIVSDEWVVFDSSKGIDLPPHQRRIGYVFQDSRLFPHLNVAQNLAYGRRFAPPGASGPTETEIIEMLGLSPFLARKPAHLSGGEKQRVAIGRALLSKPRLVLADEPLAALDDKRKQEILPYFERLRDQIKVPVIYVSHSAAEVSRLATTVVALENGKVIRQGPAAEVLSDPQITPLGPGAAGTFLSATVSRHHEDGITEVDATGTRLLIPAVEHIPGSALRIRIKAQDVMISLQNPQEISALNVLPATVTEVRKGDGPGTLVQLQVGKNTLLARVTQRSAKTLRLETGKQVFAILKAVSIPRGAIGDQNLR